MSNNILEWYYWFIFHTELVGLIIFSYKEQKLYSTRLSIYDIYEMFFVLCVLAKIQSRSLAENNKRDLKSTKLMSLVL